MIIDSHAHVYLPVEEHIRLMDEAGIDKTLLFSTTVHPEMAESTAEFEQEMKILGEIIAGKRNAIDAKIASNHELNSVIKKYPNRFIGFGNIPAGLSYEDNAQWVEKYIIANNFVGIGEFTLPSGEIASLRNVFAVSKDYGNLPIWIHAFWPLDFADIRELAALASEFSTVPVIVGHLGGMHWLEAIKVAKEEPNVYLDLSAVFTAIALKIAIKEVPHKCLFSSDMPYGDVLLARNAIERVCPDQSSREMVLGGNIQKLLKWV